MCSSWMVRHLFQRARSAEEANEIAIFIQQTKQRPELYRQVDLVEWMNENSPVEDFQMNIYVGGSL